MIYKWKTGYHPPKVSPQVVGERLEHLRKKSKAQTVTPEKVLEDARSGSSPLHKCFEWNDARAAEKYRRTQAHLLLANIEVIIRDEGTKSEHQVRAFVNVKVDDERVYTSLGAAMSNKELREQVLQTALWELESWRDKYRKLRELASVLSAADKVLDKFEKLTA